MNLIDDFTLSEIDNINKFEREITDAYGNGDIRVYRNDDDIVFYNYTGMIALIKNNRLFLF